MPWRDADDPEAWQDLTEHEHDAAWDVIYERFAFRPGMRAARVGRPRRSALLARVIAAQCRALLAHPRHPETWPAFDEPNGSITWSVESEVTRAKSATDYLSAERRVASALRDALVGSMANDGFVFALDWQHPGYKFEPSKAAAPLSIDSWLVPALPNGDYYLFLAEDLRFGWLSISPERPSMLWT